MMELLFPAIPEIFVLTMACVVLIVEVYLGHKFPKLAYHLSQITLVAACLITYYVFINLSNQHTFHSSFVFDSMGFVLKEFIFLVVAAVFVYSRQYLHLRGLFRGEFYVLGLFAVLGMMVMVSAYSLLTLYLGLELLALSLYALVAYHRDNKEASEAAMKYFVLGAIASGMLLYGMSMVYGVIGSLEIMKIAETLATGQVNNLVLTFGVVFLIVGLAFKLGAVPFHMWVPDVYQGSPTAVTVFIGTAPKIAAFAMVMRLLVEGLGGLHDQWQGMLIILSILSMGIGNIVAIAQTNIKRMLAYSTISHIGFLLLGILAGTKGGNTASMFYVITYAIMSLGGFGMIMLLSRAGFEAENLDDFRGLNERSPWYAAMMGILMLSMAGIPPLVGFYGKFAVLQAVVNSGLIWLAIVAVMFSVIGAYYYLRVIKLMYFDEPKDLAPIDSSMDIRIGVSINAVLVMALGIYPTALMQMCAMALGGFTIGATP